MFYPNKVSQIIFQSVGTPTHAINNHALKQE